MDRYSGVRLTVKGCAQRHDGCSRPAGHADGNVVEIAVEGRVGPGGMKCVVEIGYARWR